MKSHGAEQVNKCISIKDYKDKLAYIN